jgi:hypothetical protein
MAKIYVPDNVSKNENKKDEPIKWTTTHLKEMGFCP